MEITFTVGQKWISESEPDLGLGTVVRLEKGRVQILFGASGALRTYAVSGAPLKRVRFRAGDKIAIKDEPLLIVDSLQEKDDLITYIADGRAIPESQLDDSISFHTAKDRLLSGQLDESGAFELRRRTLELRRYQQASAVRGFIGGRIDLIPHQLYIAHEVSARFAPRVLLSDEVGLGKTIEACLILHRMLLGGRATRILIVVPESLVHQWFVEMLRRFNIWLHIFDEERCEAIEAGAPDNNPFLDDQLVLCSLEFLTGSEKRSAQAVSAGWDVLVVDEAHHLAWSDGNPGREYLVVEALGRGSQGLLLLTATPEQFGIEGHFARLRLLDPNRYTDLEAFQHESKGYRQIAGMVEKIEKGTQLEPEETLFVNNRLGPAAADPIKSERERQVLIDRMLDLYGPGRVVFRNRRASMRGFPARIAHLTALPTPDDDASWHEMAAREFNWDTGRVSIQPAYDFTRDPRLDWLVRFVQDKDSEKILLICRSKEKALALHEAFRQRVSISAGIFHEDLTLIQRDRNAAWFADEQGARLLICSEIGSEGRNFQFSHHLVLLDLPINAELLEQRIGRLDRIGQKEDIHIHVPFVAGSPQELLARWYHEGLDAFQKNLVGSNRELEALSGRILEIANETVHLSRPEVDEHIDALIAQTRRFQRELEADLLQGRDRLLEMNSFRPDMARSLIDAIREEDRNPVLERYMLDVFEYFGIQIEELAPRTYYLNPARMTIEAFPSLPEDGLSVTFDRSRALVREEIAFLSWDHPMVTGVLDIMSGSEKGNSSFGVILDEENNALMLEAIFMLETVAGHRSAVNRYLPATPIRVLVDRAGEDLTDRISPDLLSRQIHRGNPSRFLENSLVTGQLIPDMLDGAQALAASEMRQKIATSLEKLQADLELEIDRLKSLQMLNDHVRPAEIEMAERFKTDLEQVIKNARIRLDALRLIWKGFTG